MTILIVTNRDDVHADLVIPQIEGAGGRAVRINTEDFAKTISFDLSDVGDSLKLHDSDRRLELEEVTAVWYRKPAPVCPPEAVVFEPARRFIANESEALIRSIYDLLGDRYWMSPIWAIRRASQKIPNLRIAKALGLQTPDTLVTNRPAAVERFGEEHGWKLIAKPFALESFKADGPGSPSFDVFAARFDRDVFETRREAVRQAPVFLQAYVEKQLELRVTIVVDEVFCTAIHSQDHPQAAEDWRAAPVEELQHEAFDLPDNIKAQLLAYNRTFGLQFSAVDLILDRDGRYVFLECNANGQWRWLEDLTGQPISQAITRALLRGG